MTMGDLLDGFEAARQRQEALLAERHRREEDVDHHLHALVDVLDQDKTFMNQHRVTPEVAHRTLHINHDRSPVITVHYDPEVAIYRVTFMGDGAQTETGTVEETAKAIGEILFKVITKK
jgi:hypothetical protein